MYGSVVSPIREYEITLADFFNDSFTVHATLPKNLTNTPFMVGTWFSKYVPEDMEIVDVVPFVEAEDGDELDYIDEENVDDGFSSFFENEEEM